MDPTIVSAIVGALAGLAVSVPAAIISNRSYKLAVKQYEAATRLDSQVIARVTEMLSHEQWESRSFEAISRSLKGMAPDDIRKALIAIGAVSTESRDGKELWSRVDRKGRDTMGAFASQYLDQPNPPL